MGRASCRQFDEMMMKQNKGIGQLTQAVSLFYICVMHSNKTTAYKFHFLL